MRGAEARDARSALLVGTTYDPALLRQIGADGPMADAAQAAPGISGKGMGRTLRAAKAGSAGARALTSTRRVPRARQPHRRLPAHVSRAEASLPTSCCCGPIRGNWRNWPARRHRASSSRETMAPVKA